MYQTQERKTRSPEIIRYDNHFNEIHGFNQLTGKTQNLFFAILVEIQKQISNRPLEDQYLLKFLDVRRMAGLTKAKNGVNHSVLNRMIEAINTKLCDLIQIERIRKIRPYTRIPRNQSREFVWMAADMPYRSKAIYLSVLLTEKAKKLFFNIDDTGNITEFSFGSYKAMSRKYAKAIYRLLMNHDHRIRGEYNAKIEDFVHRIGANDFNYVKNDMGKILNQLKETGDFRECDYSLRTYENENGEIKTERILFKYEVDKNIYPHCTEEINRRYKNTTSMVTTLHNTHMPSREEVRDYFDSLKKERIIPDNLSPDDYYESLANISKILHDLLCNWKEHARLWIQTNSGAK